jgi:acyl-CoA hydrolase
MTAWQEYYKSHLVTMDEAAKAIKSGDKLWCGETVSISYNFLNKLNEHRDTLKDVTILYNFSTSMFDMLFDEDVKDHFRLISMFTGPLDRMSGHMGIQEFHSMPYEMLIRAVMDVYGAEIMVTEMCPPDENGYMNCSILGVGIDSIIHRDPRIKMKIAVVNKHQSRAPGDFDKINFPVTDFEMIIEDDHEMSYLPVSDPTEVDKKIAAHVMQYINDGDTIQIGMGGLGEQITKELYSKKNMKVYTEITVDSMVPLVDAGVVLSVRSAGCYGSPIVYEFLGTSDKVIMEDLYSMLDPFSIGEQDNLVAINSTLMVDLTGQACSEAQGIKQYSSVGGSFGYLYGAIRSKGGRSFLCLRSTYRDDNGERHSNIVPWLPEKCVVTTPRYLTMYIVSEHGVADVFLRTNKDRIRRLLKIAHPDYRAELKEQIVSTGQIAAEEFDD